MGNWASRMLAWMWSGFEKDPVSILMLGLDAAGKTTIMYKVKYNEQQSTIPTIGFNVETVDIGKGVSFTIWDVGGQEILRPLWRYYYETAKGLVYVVDCNDRERLDEAREELVNILNDPLMQGVPVVVLANKQDLPNACSASELTSRLCLNKLSNKWYIQPSCAVSGDGLFEAFHEMASMVKEHVKMRR